MNEIKGLSFRGCGVAIIICAILVAFYIVFSTLEAPRDICSNQMRKSSLSMSLTADICHTKEGRDKVGKYYHYHLQKLEILRVVIQKIHLERLDEKLQQKEEGL